VESVGCAQARSLPLVRIDHTEFAKGGGVSRQLQAARPLCDVHAVPPAKPPALPIPAANQAQLTGKVGVSASSSTSALASFRTGVSKHSVTQR
jgi:hypothetical protein